MACLRGGRTQGDCSRPGARAAACDFPKPGQRPTHPYLFPKEEDVLGSGLTCSFSSAKFLQ